MASSESIGSIHRRVATALDQLTFDPLYRRLEPSYSERNEMMTKIVASSDRFLDWLDNARGNYDADEKTTTVNDSMSSSPLLPLPKGVPLHGLPLDDLLQMIDHGIARPGLATASGRYLGYVPGGGIVHSAMADYMADIINKFSGEFSCAPGAVQIENQMIRWAADLIGYGPEASGTSLSGGSLSGMTALVAARAHHKIKSNDVTSCCVYLTEHAHHSIMKALHLVGMGEVQIRRVGVDHRHAMDTKHLLQLITTDKANGYKPWLIVASAGTTNTGAVDPLMTIGEIASKYQCWYHVDGAYGGFFLLTKHGSHLFRGIEQADSVVLDPHKGLFLPYGSGMLIVKRRDTLTHGLHHGSGAYMQDLNQSPLEVSPSHVSPELSRPFRALRMWLPLMLMGQQTFTSALDEKLLLAQYFYATMSLHALEDGWVMPSHPPLLSVVTFHWQPPSASSLVLSRAQLNQANQLIADNVRRDPNGVFMSSTMLNDRFTLRLVVLSFRTHRHHIDLAIQLLRHHAKRTLMTLEETNRISSTLSASIRSKL
jgi:aromatic-L-amino-acid decarboxylase